MAEKIRTIVIDDFREGDIDDALDIEQTSFTTPWSRILFFNELKHPRSFARAARVSGRLTGYLCSRLVVDEGHIHNLAVHPGARRLGIASALVEDMISLLREGGARCVYLEVRDSNEAAKSLYRRFNFEVIGLRKAYYTLPVEHAVMMSLKLSS